MEARRFCRAERTREKSGVPPTRVYESRLLGNATSARPTLRCRQREDCSLLFFWAEAEEGFGRAECKAPPRRERFARVRVFFFFREKIRGHPIGAHGRILPRGITGIAARGVCRLSRRVPSPPDSSLLAISGPAVLRPFFEAFASAAIRAGRRESRRASQGRAQRYHRARHILHRTRC